jgi:MFS family permease
MRRLFLLVSAAVLVDTMFYAAIAPLLPTYEDQLGLSKTAAGILSASYAAGTLVGALPGGWLAGRAGAKPTMVFGLALLSVTSVGFAFADTVVLLDAARFVQGLGGACTWAGGFAWLIGSAPRDRRGQLIGTALGAAIFGLLLGPVIGGAATQTSPQLVFTAVAAVAVGLLAWALGTPPGPREEQATWRQLGEAVRRRGVIMAVWLFIIPALFSGVFDVLVPLRLDDLGAAGLTIGAVFLAGAAIQGVLSPIVGRLSDRRGRLLPLRAGLAGGAVMALLLPLPASVPLVAAAALLAVTALGCFWAPAAALLSDASESEGLDQGFAFGLMNLAWAGGQVVGGAAGAGLADATSDAVPYAILALLCAASLVLTGGRARSYA